MPKDQVINVPTTEVEFNAPEPNLKATYDYSFGYLICSELTTRLVVRDLTTNSFSLPNSLEDSCTHFIFQGLAPFAVSHILAMEKEVDVTERLKKEAQSKN